ncbi:hypothetical protein [Burkholderia ubonensis]|uniref:hypothetical protein n=1 Tax=Burkholderia ubonensis TaxID=101571 RepID=UPI000A7A3991|nr:hypothetical protein [Burkholderia ubonensis]
MKLPRYLQILLGLTVLACGYLLWQDWSGHSATVGHVSGGRPVNAPAASVMRKAPVAARRQPVSEANARHPASDRQPMDTTAPRLGPRPTAPQLAGNDNARPSEGSSDAVADAPPNLFPAQSWMPSFAAPSATPAIALPDPARSADRGVPPVPPPRLDNAGNPLRITAEWRYPGQGPAVAVEGGGNSYILCDACGLPGSIRPGQVFDSGYQLDAIDDRQVTLMQLRSKRKIVLPLALESIARG